MSPSTESIKMSNEELEKIKEWMSITNKSIGDINDMLKTLTRGFKELMNQVESLKIEVLGK